MGIVRFVLCLVACAASALPGLASARSIDTASCDGKQGWQRSIVQTAVHDWFRNAPRASSLIDLVQAEHGITACSHGTRVPTRLHTRTLPAGLGLDQLGGYVLANELEWSGLMAAPEDGLLGVSFPVGERRRLAEPAALARGEGAPAAGFEGSRAGGVGAGSAR